MIDRVGDNQVPTPVTARTPVPVQSRPLVAVPAQAATALQLRAQRVLVRALPQVRYQIMRVGPVGLSGIAALIAAAVVGLGLLLPAQHSVLALRAELSKAGHALPASAPQDASPHQFTSTLPAREQVPALLGVVLAQAADSGVVLEQGRYTYSPATASRLARYTLEFPVKGEYSNVRSFINKVLVAIPALGLDKLHLERKNVGDTLVNADVGFVIYLRGT